ncbi:hypothetical protein RJ640_024224 [Escallonia rubra]|uniref:F-box domain-containing protein n=1 Tax=Escallonia rubra TaxID=112253 RepID=A0AA88S854_9ASTE|nr:hypothetical protein RJ640_024224 [Escallonia rubra]
MSDVFPPKVLANILSRLPVTSLLRFRSVSKPWGALIDSPHFIKLHLSHSKESNNSTTIILRDSYLYSVQFDSLDNATELSHPLKSTQVGTEVLGSCNGLLCLFNTRNTNILWSPSTRKYQKLPATRIVGMGICQYVVYGFGFDCASDDYKVVRMVQFYGADDDSFGSEVKVYSLNSNSWQRIQDFPYYLRYKLCHGVLASRALHWVVSRKPESDAENLIAAFDLGSEEYRLVPQPEYCDNGFHMNVGVLGGCICVICNYCLRNADIWVMTEYGVRKSWVKLISVAQPRDIRSLEYVRPITYSKSGERVLLEQDHGRLLWYDLRKKIVNNVELRGVSDFLEANVCLGSLVQLNDSGEIEGKKKRANKEKKKKKTNKRRKCQNEREERLLKSAPGKAGCVCLLDAHHS